MLTRQTLAIPALGALLATCGESSGGTPDGELVRGEGNRLFKRLVEVE